MKKFIIAFLLIALSATYVVCEENTLDSKDSAVGLTPTPSIVKPGQSHSKKASAAIVIHKPQTDPAWGKVIQYHREQIGSPMDKNHETLHEFLFQDDQGVVRTAIFHESTSTDGYWEVLIWDQP